MPFVVPAIVFVVLVLFVRANPDPVVSWRPSTSSRTT